MDGTPVREVTFEAGTKWKEGARMSVPGKEKSEHRGPGGACAISEEQSEGQCGGRQGVKQRTWEMRACQAAAGSAYSFRQESKMI